MHRRPTPVLGSTGERAVSGKFCPTGGGVLLGEDDKFAAINYVIIGCGFGRLKRNKGIADPANEMGQRPKKRCIFIGVLCLSFGAESVGNISHEGIYSYLASGVWYWDELCWVDFACHG